MDNEFQSIQSIQINSLVDHIHVFSSIDEENGKDNEREEFELFIGIEEKGRKRGNSENHN